MSEFDEFDRILEEIVRMTTRMMNPDQGANVNAERPERPTAEPDELIDGKDSVTYVLQAPGYRASDLDVSFGSGEITVRAPDFSVSKPLPEDAEISSAVTEYRNGILSVRMRKRK